MLNHFFKVGLGCLLATFTLVLSGSEPSIRILFASLEEGRKILGARDGFIQRLSPFDRAARLKTDREVDESEFLKFVASNVVAWDSEYREKVEQAFERIRPALGDFPLNWPERIYFVQTTGEEEGGAAYTRGNVVILPRARLNLSLEKLTRLVGHELFHILTRYDQDIRDRLYRVIGFEPCPEVELPDSFNRRRITNPDAPISSHRIRVQKDGRQFWAVPILYSNRDRYDPLQGGSFFEYIQFRLLMEAVEVIPKTSVASSAKLNLVKVEEVSGFFEQIGRNSSYIIHPEEILAVNFALIVTGWTEFLSPEVAENIRTVLQEGVSQSSLDRQ